MRIQNYTIAIICLFLVSNLEAAELKKIKSGSYSASFYTENGMLNGKYQSFYPDETLKSEGSYANNQRTGIWSIYDKKGNLILKRDYQNNFTFTQLYPDLPKDESIRLLESCSFIPQRNSDGFYDYRKIYENDIQFSKKVVCVVFPDENIGVLDAENFLNMICENKDLDDFKVYEVFKSYAASKSNIETADNKKIIAFKFTEEYVFDLKTQAMESRVIFICPVVKDLKTGKVLSDNWFYFPSLIKYIAKFECAKDKSTDLLKNMSDAFYFDSYCKHIVDIGATHNGFKLSTDHADEIVKNGKLSNDQLQKSEEFKISLIETEHDLLLSSFALEE
jgi:hypothetical protein